MILFVIIEAEGLKYMYSNALYSYINVRLYIQGAHPVDW